MTSKRSRERPGASRRKQEKRTALNKSDALKRASRKHLLLRASQRSPGSQGRVAAPESIQIGASPLPGRHCLHTLNLKEPYDIFPLPAVCLPGPKIYVEQHPAPAFYLPFQLGLKGVPLAQSETIDGLLPGPRARDSSEQVVDLAWGPLF